MRTLFAIAVLVACSGAWSQNSMQIFIRPVDSYAAQALPSSVALNVYQQDTIATVKLKIEDTQGIPFGRQVLIFADQWLDDVQTLEFYGVGKESTVYLMLRQPPPNPVPTLPLFGLLALGSLLGLFGLRKLKQ